MEKKLDFKIVALLILLGFFVGLVCVHLEVEKGREAERQRFLEMEEAMAEEIAIQSVAGFSNGTVILMVAKIDTIESTYIIMARLRDSHDNTIEKTDSIHEEIPVSEEIQFSVTFNAENIQLTDDYTVILASEKGNILRSPSFKFSNTD